MGTFIVGVILILIIGAIIRSMIINKKNGKSHCAGCSSGCGHCNGHCK